MSISIVFRTDASIDIGTGHVMRCLTLADELRERGANCRFVCRAHVGNLIDQIDERGYEVQMLPITTNRIQCDSLLAHASWLGTDWLTDAHQTLAVLGDKREDWLIVDHYALDARWERILSSSYRRLMVIDDLADRHHQCALLLDQNLGRQTQDYVNLVPAQCKVLTGSQYALIRPEFNALRSYSLQRRQQPVLKQVLISMGGVDQSNVTSQLLQALKCCELPQDCHFSVVMGLNAPWLQEVRELAENMPWPTEVLVNISDMAQRMADSDLAIGAAGSTSWERCCMGLPALMVVLADNQRVIAEALQRSGAAKIMDNVSAVSMKCNELSAHAANYRSLHDMSIAAARVVDGLGSSRVLSHFSALENS